MTTFLAVLGLFFLVVAAVGTGYYVAVRPGAPVLPAPPVYPAPRGLLIERIDDFSRSVEFCADYATAQRMKRLGVVRMLWRDSATGDMHWLLSVSQLADWAGVKAALLPALPQTKREMAIVQHQGWMS